jgi:hypothetical protein
MREPEKAEDHSRRLELVVGDLPDSAEVGVGATDADRHAIAMLQTSPNAIGLCLRDSAGLVRWEPDGHELPYTGEVFARLLAQLYDGRQYVVCLDLAMHLMLFAGGSSPAEVIETNPPWEWYVQLMSAQGLGHAFSVAIPPDCEECDGDDGCRECEEGRIEHWWCPKRSLLRTLRAGWDWNCKGYVVLQRRRTQLEECFRASDPASVLERLLDLCEFVFEGGFHGSQLYLLSHRIGFDEVRAATAHSSVQRALRKLSRHAVFANWVPIGEQNGYTIYGKRRP